jgi:2-(1,2-epoxy-1,2-dihydrophenyl)acetyl-CoA isomerase
MTEATKLATALAAGATGAFGAAKRSLHNGWTETVETQMELESQAIAARAHTADGDEGISAFLEKRTPNFTGK